MGLFDKQQSSSIGTAIGLTVAAIAVVGTQFLGWEWGSDQLVPTVIGIVVAVIAIVAVVAQRR